MKIEFSKTITSWDEAVPLGNGICGALIWNSSRNLRFSLDRGDIWDTTPYPGIYEDDYTYATMVKLVKERNNAKIRQIFDAPYNQTVPTKLPAGKIIFDFGFDANISSELNINQAEAQIRVGEKILVKSFLHAEQQIGMIQINQPLNTFSFYVDNPKYGVEGIHTEEKDVIHVVETPSLEKLVYPAPEVVEDRCVKYFVQHIGQGLSYGIFTRVKEYGDKVEIAYTIATSNDTESWKEDALKRVEEALECGYDNLFQSHTKWWKQFWEKSSIEVPDPLFQERWYLTQYFLASCSRKGGYPMPLQGVWTADHGMLPPWKGDYHLDLNLEMCYYGYLKANHWEEGECVIDFIWNLADCGRKFAKRYFHSTGICLPSTMTITGESLGGWGLYSMSPTNQLWICQMFERHYRYTGDRQFLKEKAYPYLEESAEFILGILEEREGYYYLPISTSPEIHDDELEAYVTPNSNYDLALMHCLFQTLIKWSEELKNGKTEKWKSVLSHLPDLAINEKGVLMISPDEELQESHRHYSHAMAIHPLRLLSYENPDDRRIIDATILDLEQLGSGHWNGFSFTWIAEFYAIQKNGNAAARYLETFWKYICSPNGFNMDGDYRNYGISAHHSRAFTLEATMCAADALQEMMLYTEDGFLQLFPAIPDAWMEETVSFEGFCAEKGLLVSAVMRQGQVISLKLQPKYAGTVYLKIDEKSTALIDRMREDFRVNGDWIELTLCEENNYIYEL